ncbi:hypothetical protein A5747_13700 [Mycobacterium sp. IS-836]|uniref:hypothetical protein n=1 Tax=Mycobacterium sp. IS-836 TaxID=1834160 RepID=UPI00096E9365|nr:hypothetical protein [Mycobacterium sp. IS-836]OMC55438.1 hypothetical protein A5747_13700 [Mycobacterium sp. IS-836]
MSDLAERMVDAAKTLEEASAHYGYPFPLHVHWSADDLRHEAPRVAEEEREAAEREAAIEEIARTIFSRMFPIAHPEDNPITMDVYRKIAAEILDIGYRKD